MKKYLFLCSLVSITFFFLGLNVAKAAGCCVVKVDSSNSLCFIDLTEAQCKEEARQMKVKTYSLDSSDTKCTKNKSVCGNYFVYCTKDSDCDSTESCQSTTDDSLGNRKQCLAKSNATPAITPSTSSASGASATSSITIEFPNPLTYDTVEGFLGNVLSTIRSVIIVLSIIFIVLGGIFYITSAGNEKRMTAAKGAIFASMIGLAIGIAAPSFLKEIYNIMGGNSSGIDSSSLTGLSLTQIALNFLNFLLSVVGVLALIMLIIGGIMYLTSAGDEDKIKTGKKIVTYSIIGIAVALAALVIVKQIASLLA